MVVPPPVQYLTLLSLLLSKLLTLPPPPLLIFILNLLYTSLSVLLPSVQHCAVCIPIHVLACFVHSSIAAPKEYTHRVATTAAFWHTFHHDGKICPGW
jgi:hypothetical protein